MRKGRIFPKPGIAAVLSHIQIFAPWNARILGNTADIRYGLFAQMKQLLLPVRGKRVFPHIQRHGEPDFFRTK